MDQRLLLTDSLRATPQGEFVTRTLAAALDAVDPAAAVTRFLRRTGTTLLVGDNAYDLAAIERVLLVGAGKAGVPMAEAALQVLGPYAAGGVLVVKDGYAGGGKTRRQEDKKTGRQEDRKTRRQEDGEHAGNRASLDVREAGHPLPDERGVAATQAIAELLAGTTARDLVVALISGGGSALLTRPVPGVRLADMQQLTGLLLRSGASIDEINTLRKHLDTVKGGGLARMAFPAPTVALILSDVVGSPLDVIASGPTVADPTTYADALAILDHYGLAADTPPAISMHLRRGAAGELEETLKPGDQRLAHVTNLIVGSNMQAAQAALATARQAGFNTLLLSTYAQGEARALGRTLGAIARELAASGNPISRPACLVVGGETTVALHGNGLGGRNQELALAAVGELAGLRDVALVALATDGGDGPTDAAGAVVTGDTLARATALGLDPADFLARNDAYHFFAPLGDLLRPGPTRTNVNDLAFLFAF